LVAQLLTRAAAAFAHLRARAYAGDQGQLFLSANASWLSPHGVADNMLGALAALGLGAVVAVEAAPAPAGQPALDIVALSDASGGAAALLGVSIVNTGNENVTALVELRGCIASGEPLNVTTAFGDAGDQNDPAAPNRVRPLQSAKVLDSNNSATLLLAPRSFTTLVARCAVARGAFRAAALNNTTCDASP